MKKKYVYNQHGFLLLEYMITLFLTALLSLIIILLLHVVKSYEISPNRITHQEIESLATRLKKEVRLAESFSISDQRLLIRFNNQPVVSYHVQNNRLIRQVNRVGGEIALYHCKRLNIELLNENSVKLEIISTFDETFLIYLSTLKLPVEQEAVLHEIDYQ